MMGIVNAGTLHAGLKLGGRLIASGNAESLPFLREVFAGAVDTKHPAASDELLGQIQQWIVPIVRQAGIRADAPDLGKVSKIIRDLTAYGFADEAVRVLITAIGFDPSKGVQFVDATRKAFAEPLTGHMEGADEVAFGLMDMGLGYLKCGVIDGITFMSAARRIGQIPLPTGEIERSLEDIPSRAVVREHGVAQDVTDYAYDVQRVGPLKTAVGIGMLVPSMLDTDAEQDIITGLASASHSNDPGVINVGRRMATKGYAPQAAEFMVASGVSPQAAWNAFDKKFVVAHPAVNPPWVMKSYGRVVTNAVASVARTAQPPDFDAMRKIVFEHQATSAAPVVLESSTPTPSDAKDKALYFLLDGDGVHCDEVKWETEFDLVFNYDSPPPEALVELFGKRFEILKNSEATLEINVMPVGLIRRDRISSQEIAFKNGVMEGEPARFKFKAPAKNSGDHTKAGVWVAFSSRRTSLYKTFLSIKLVDALGTTPCERRKVDLDLEEVIKGASKPRDAEVFIYSDGGAWDISWNITDSRKKEPTRISRKELTRIKGLSKAELEAEYKNQGFIDDLVQVARKPLWNQVDRNLSLPKDEKDLADLAEECMKITMTAGSKLYDILCHEPVFEELMNEIGQLEKGARITFHTQNMVFPWELIYPLPYDNGPLENENHKLFWGARFHIESLLIVPEGEEKSLPDSQQPGTLRISMGLNKDIDRDDPWKSKLPPGPAELQQIFFDAEFKPYGDCVDTRAGVDKILKRDDPASMVYFYCHGNSNQLIFEKSQSPILANAVMKPPFPNRPIVFINACDTGNISPLSFISFRTKFYEKKAAGVIAPSFPIPALFAAYFGEDVLRRYSKKEPIGEIIFSLRQRLLEQNNPLGLWYSIQCPLDIVAPEA